MSEQKYRVFVQRENEKGRTLGWRPTWLKLDRTTQTLSLESIGSLAKKWSASIRPGDVDGFEILMISDPTTMAAMYGGGLLGYGIAALMSRWAKLPVVKLSQATGVPGMRWFHIRGTGFQQRKATRTAAVELGNWLREGGYSGVMPNLDDEELWKFPLIPVLVGCGLVLVVSVACLILLAIIASGSS
jgi:hypothetical protein